MKTPWNTPITDLCPDYPKFPSARELLDKYAAEHLPALGKEIAELTNDEKTALCIKAGVPFRILPPQEGSECFVKFSTAVQVGFIKEQDGSYRVIQDNPLHGRGQVIHFKPKKPA